MEEKLLKESLRTLMEQDIEKIEKSMKNNPEHVFSNAFETEMKALISKSDKRYVSIGKRTFRKASMIAAVAIMLFACVGFSPIAKAVWDYCTTIFQKEEFGNIAMGLGRAAFDGQKVYFGVSEGHGINLYSYDVRSEELDFISFEKTPMRASLFADDEFLYYRKVKNENMPNN